MGPMEVCVSLGPVGGGDGAPASGPTPLGRGPPGDVTKRHGLPLLVATQTPALPALEGCLEASRHVAGEAV